jgi:hypothetical protein
MATELNRGLSEPVHAGAAGPGDPPWRDNAFLAFWDEHSGLYGCAHVSTSPNSEGRRARCSVAALGRRVEVVEPLVPGTFDSDSLTFDLSGRLIVDTPDLRVDLRSTPRFSAADYSAGQIVPGIVAGAPLRHFQQGCEVEGDVVVGDTKITLRGRGFRDRTWGYRDESQTWTEYVAVIGCFPDFDITFMKFKGVDGSMTVEGYQIADELRRADEMRITRDASGLLSRLDVGFGDGAEVSVEVTGHPGGFWVPLGRDGRSGPTMSSYDDFVSLASFSGATGFGMVEQGIIRTVF